MLPKKRGWRNIIAKDESVNIFSREEIDRAKEINLFDYLNATSPSELVHVSRETYCTREHDSLRISNGMWYWFSRGFGGKSALDYLVRVKGYSFEQSVDAILNNIPILISNERKNVRHKERKDFVLPGRADNNCRVKQYLLMRGINAEIIDYCIKKDLLYEGISDAGYHNAVFVGKDAEGEPRYAFLRGIGGSFKGESTGSDKRYSFCISPQESSDILHIFESAIDLLSFATCEKLKESKWNSKHLLSLAGVYDAKGKTKLPISLEMYLERFKEISKIYLHFDRDLIGRGAAHNIRKLLEAKYMVYDVPVCHGKDVNDELMYMLKNRKREDYDR